MIHGKKNKCGRSSKLLVAFNFKTYIGDKAYKDYEDISSEDFLDVAASGETPTSSQPAIGDVLEIFEDVHEEILHLSLGDGLFGAYQNAVGARNCIDKNCHIHVVDTKTLAGPQHYLVQKALYPWRTGLYRNSSDSEINVTIFSI